MSDDYTPTPGEIMQALAFCRAYGQGGIPECPDNEVPMDAVRRGVNKIVGEAFERGFNAGYYNRDGVKLAARIAERTAMSKFEQAIEAGARALHAVDPDQSYGEDFENCCARDWEMKDARAVITAALPLIREVIASEVREAVELLGKPRIPHRDELAQAIARGYEPDQPVPNRHDYNAADSVLRLLEEL